MSLKHPTINLAVAILLLSGATWALAESDNHECEGQFRAGHECSKGVDGDWMTSAVPDAYGDSVAVIENHAIPSGASAARWHFRVLRNYPGIEIRAYYWDYVTSEWTVFYNVPVDIDYTTYTVDVPANGLISSPLRTKMHVKNAVSPLVSGEYLEGVVDWIYPDLSPNTLYIPEIHISCLDSAIMATGIVVPLKFRCQTPTVMMNIPIEWDEPNLHLDSVSVVGTACEDWTLAIDIDNDNQTVVIGLFDFQGHPIQSGWDTIVAKLHFWINDPTSLSCNLFVSFDTTFSDDEQKKLLFNDDANPPNEYVPAVAFETATIGTYKPGDLNDNLVVNPTDITYFINYLYKWGVAPRCLDAADVDGNCSVNLLDITYLINYLYKGGPAPMCGCADGSGAYKLSPVAEGVLNKTTENGRTTITLSTPVDIMGVEMTLKSVDGSTLNLKSLADGLSLFAGQADDEIKLAMLDIQGQRMIKPGEHKILEIDGEVEIVYALGSDESANAVYLEIVSGANKTEALPHEFVLYQNYPNPFNPTTEISFSLPHASNVMLEIYNITGQKVATLTSGHLEAGEHSFTWDGSNSASGVYFYRLKAGEFTKAKKMLLLK